MSTGSRVSLHLWSIGGHVNLHCVRVRFAPREMSPYRRVSREFSCTFGYGNCFKVPCLWLQMAVMPAQCIASPTAPMQSVTMLGTAPLLRQHLPTGRELWLPAAQQMAQTSLGQFLSPFYMPPPTLLSSIEV